MRARAVEFTRPSSRRNALFEQRGKEARHWRPLLQLNILSIRSADDEAADDVDRGRGDGDRAEDRDDRVDRASRGPESGRRDDRDPEIAFGTP